MDDRSQYIGASEVAGLLRHPDDLTVSLSPYLTPRALYGVKRRLVEPEPPSMLMEAGNALEPVVIARARRDGLLPVGTEQGPPLGAPSLRCGWLGAHPDLISAEGPIDVKCVFRTSDAWDDGIPVHYVAQLAAQLACLGARSGRAAILSCHIDRGMELRLAWIEVGAEWVEAATESAAAFMEGCVLPGIMPPAVRAAPKATAYPLPEAATVRPATARELEIVARLRSLTPTLAEVESLRAELAESAADTPAIVDPDGQVLATYRPERRSVLDRSAIPADVLAAATRTQEARVLRLKRSKQ